MKINEINARVYKQPVSFGRKTEEHKSWGAVINPVTNTASFKLFTYPDAKGVVAHVYPQNSDRTLKIELENKGRGVFEKRNITPNVVKNGDKYEYIIYKNDNTTETVKDPYSFKQEQINGPSTIYNQNEFKWQNDKIWKNNPARIKKANIKEARIYAINPDTFTEQRSYEGVISGLKNIKKTGFNAIEIMHIENTYSYNWGYDGVDKHAPSDFLGGPDGLKHLVDAAHKEGLAVIFDIVPNHIGPDGCQLEKSGPYVKGTNDFGYAFNYEGQDSEYVRDFTINAALNWVQNYHADGLRLDMTKYMESDYTLKQLAAEINYHCPDCFLIAEDGRECISVDEKGNYRYNPDEIHDKRVVRKLSGEEYGANKNEGAHDIKIKKIINNNADLSKLGMDSEWDFAFYHRLNQSLYNPDTDELLKGILNAQNGVKYVASHDEIGNFEGTRKIAKLMVPKLMLNHHVVLSDEDIERAKKYSQLKKVPYDTAEQQIKFQKAQLVSETLAVKYQCGELEKYKKTEGMSRNEVLNLRKALDNEVLTPLGIYPNSKISYTKISRAFEQSFRQSKMAFTLTYSIPGPKMVFQGDEMLDLTPFRFFRRFESVPNEDYLYTEKGYQPAEPALLDSTMGKIEYSSTGKERMREFKQLTRDLNRMNIKNSALTYGEIQEDSVVNHPISSVIAYNAKDNDNEIFTITNLSEIGYSEHKGTEYYIKFPKGKWIEVLNTDNSKYGGTSNHLNEGEVIKGDGIKNMPVNMAGYSTICFKRVG